MGLLKDKEIILAVTGGIAGYKAVELLRMLTEAGAGVQVVMTENACQFVGPITFEALSGRQVGLDLFAPGQEAVMAHIELARQVDLLVIVPATANVLAKLAAGLADDLLTTLVLACRSPVILAPAMNVAMWEKPAVQSNVKRVQGLGYRLVGPEQGELACGDEGYGRLASLAAIWEEMEAALSPNDLSKETIIVTAGPTQEAIDPVRFLSNRSSGRMGYALARVARRRGARVILISGPVSLPSPGRVEVVEVNSAAKMREAVLKHWQAASALVMAAAVTDFKPAKSSKVKVKKGEFPASIPVKANPDILKELGEKKGDRILIGFAAETDNVVDNARLKVKEKNLDLIVANDVTRPDSGFGTDTNRVQLINQDLEMTDLPLLTKEEVADSVLDRLVQIREKRAAKLSRP